MDKLYTIKEAAVALGISLTTLERIIKRSEITVIRLSLRKRAIREKDLNEYLESKRYTGSGGDGNE
jgi:excisionase family DNA binding protein